MNFRIKSWFGGRKKDARREDGREDARKFVDRGNAAEKAGDLEQACQYYRKAIDADHSYAPSHLNLGIALHAAGDLTAAIASYEQAIAIDAGYGLAYYNLALAYLLRLEYSEAATAFRSALQFLGDSPECLVGLASALEMLGQDEEAASALTQAIALRSEFVGAQFNLSALLVKLGRLEAAVASDRRVLELEPENYLAQCRLGKCLLHLGQPVEAESRFRNALRFQSDYLDAKVCLALLLKSMGRAAEAIPLLFEAVANAPTDARLRMALSNALFGIGPTKANEEERRILLSLSMDDSVPLLYLQTAIVTLMKNDKGFRILQESIESGDDPFTMIRPEVAAFMREPLMLSALPRINVADIDVEPVFGHLRNCILRRFTELHASAAADPTIPAKFICALAQQCFFTGYAYYRDDDEIAQVATVREAIQEALEQGTATPRNVEWALAVASLYDSLHTLRGYDRLLEFPAAEWTDSFRPLLREQIENRKREREIALQMTAITPIDDAISMAVRAQYEENPYPRWASVSSPATDTIENLEQKLRPSRNARNRPRPVPILVAGCGTGQHPILVAKAFPDCEILALDLSLASLAYALRMTEQLCIRNITYGQADILKLGSLGRRFAVIESCGVLHHLDNPMAGWQVLVNLLESDGLMKIALYSESARVGVRAARDFVRSANLPLTPDGIRQCRHQIMKLPEGHPARGVLKFNDFFTLDECRDLMLHVREHQFTLPQIAECMDLLDLQLLRLEGSANARARFSERFPDASVDTDLAAWHQFELENPNTFTSMYTFWCCRK